MPLPSPAAERRMTDEPRFYNLKKVREIEKIRNASRKEGSSVDKRK